MKNIIDTLIGSIDEKKRYRKNEKRAKALPEEYRKAYEKIKQYVWTATGVSTIDPLISVVDLLEEAAADGKKVTDVTGSDVAAFVDELVKGEATYTDKYRKKLNEGMGEE